jgi:pilus assembly protein Flp/PilA
MFLKAYTTVSVWLSDLHKRVQDEGGATAVEYALMVALIAAVIIAAVSVLGTNSSEKFQTVADTIGAAS